MPLWPWKRIALVSRPDAPLLLSLEPLTPRPVLHVRDPATDKTWTCAVGDATQHGREEDLDRLQDTLSSRFSFAGMDEELGAILYDQAVIRHSCGVDYFVHAWKDFDLVGRLNDDDDDAAPTLHARFASTVNDVTHDFRLVFRLVPRRDNGVAASRPLCDLAFCSFRNICVTRGNVFINWIEDPSPATSPVRVVEDGLAFVRGGCFEIGLNCDDDSVLVSLNDQAMTPVQVHRPRSYRWFVVEGVQLDDVFRVLTRPDTVVSAIHVSIRHMTAE